MIESLLSNLVFFPSAAFRFFTFVHLKLSSIKKFIAATSFSKYCCTFLCVQKISVSHSPCCTIQLILNEGKKKQIIMKIVAIFSVKRIFALTSSSINSNCMSSVRDFMQINMLIHLNSSDRKRGRETDYISTSIEPAWNEFLSCRICHFKIQFENQRL